MVCLLPEYNAVPEFYIKIFTFLPSILFWDQSMNNTHNFIVLSE